MGLRGDAVAGQVPGTALLPLAHLRDDSRRKEEERKGQHASEGPTKPLCGVKEVGDREGAGDLSEGMPRRADACCGLDFLGANATFFHLFSDFPTVIFSDFGLGGGLPRPLLLTGTCAHMVLRPFSTEI